MNPYSIKVRRVVRSFSQESPTQWRVTLYHKGYAVASRTFWFQWRAKRCAARLGRKYGTVPR